VGGGLVVNYWVVGDCCGDEAIVYSRGAHP